jgi:hypothetical protein
MKFLKAFDPLGVDFKPGFPQEHICQQAVAHADVAVDSPYRERDSFGLKRLMPSKHVLVNTIDERAVEIKKERRLGALHGFARFLPG